MVIQMVAGKIGKDRNLESQPVAAVQIDRLRRRFHNRHLAAGIHRLTQESICVGCLRRRANGGHALRADAIFDRRQHGTFLAGRFGESKAKIGCRRFAVCACNSDQIQFVRRVSVNNSSGFC